MQLSSLKISNFRGIQTAHILFKGHTVLIGDNNAGKSTILEAIDLVLGPDRLSRLPIIDEHDFYNGKYIGEDSSITEIKIEVIVTELSEEQIRRFKDNLEFWDTEDDLLLDESPEHIDQEHVIEALRICFTGHYDPEEDDFTGETFFCAPQLEDGTMTKFRKTDKRECGFLYLRALRTGSRALSMERGSLLDIILRIRELRPKMWEDILSKLRTTTVADDPETGLNDVLGNIQDALKKFVPADWGSQPHFKVTDLTRENLRKSLNVFMSTGTEDYFAPFHHQGTGTINTMVLALLSMIAEAKQSVIFAMEEPEIAIPPYTQKRIVNIIRKTANQAIFTSHSPFVLEEFDPSQICLVQRKRGSLFSKNVNLPEHIKPKKYSSEFRLRFAEALLAKRVLITEGTTEATSFPAAARKLEEIDPEVFSSFEALGIAVFDAETETQVSTYGKYFKALNKQVFAVFDKQTPEASAEITENVDFAYESAYKGFEDQLLEETAIESLKRFALGLIEDDLWPTHLSTYEPSSTSSEEELRDSLKRYLRWSKGASGAAEILGDSTREEMPISIRKILKDIKKQMETEMGE
jgi:Predicted ATP-dependent endonuclease of the OLD family